MLTGIGGTGVLTISAIVGMASHIEGKDSSILDMTGLAQKGGAVWSHIKGMKKTINHLATKYRPLLQTCC